MHARPSSPPRETTPPRSGSTCRRPGSSPRTRIPWWELGVFRQIALGNQCSAYFAFNAAYTLDPKSNRFTPKGPLAQAAAAVNDPENPACGR